MPPVSDVDRPSVTEGEALSREECLCPVCLEIYLEPVTLPCQHTFCKPCFLETVDKAAMLCPLCRRRVSTWARLNSKRCTLVNMLLWQRVQKAFPAQCERRLSGRDAVVHDDDDNDAVLAPRPRVCQPGEVRREYEDQISKLAEEQRALEEEESRASEEYIQHLLQEEQQQSLDQERSSREEQQMDADQRLALLLSQQLNGPGESLVNGCSDSAPLKKKRKSSAGDIERFLCPVPPAFNGSSPGLSTTADQWEVQGSPRRRQEEEDRRLALLLQKQLDQEELRRRTDRSKTSSDPYQLRPKTPSSSSSSSSSTPASSSSRSARRARQSTSSSSPVSPAPRGESSTSPAPRAVKQTTLPQMFPRLGS